MELSDQNIYQSAKRLQSVDGDFDQAMESEIQHIGFDQLVHSSIKTFNRILKSLQEVSGPTRHFVFINPDFSRYHLLNIILDLASSKIQSQSIKLWFIVDTGFRR